MTMPFAALLLIGVLSMILFPENFPGAAQRDGGGFRPESRRLRIFIWCIGVVMIVIPTAWFTWIEISLS